jgi:hypothetical protein
MTAQQPMLFQNRALCKAMESRCETLDVSDGGPQKLEVWPISSEELNASPRGWTSNRCL